MENCKSNYEINKGLFTRRFDLSYQVEIILQNNLDKLAKDLLNLINSSVRNNKLIKNFKGRDKFNTISKNEEIPFDHEIFYCSVVWEPKNFSLDESGSKEFKFYLLTPFDHFDNTDIFHKFIVSTDGATPRDFNIDYLISNSNFHIKSFRLGLNFFGQSAFANWFFPTPVVLESIIIEARSDTLNLEITSENHKEKPTALYDQQGIIKKILELINQNCNLNLLNDLKQMQK